MIGNPELKSGSGVDFISYMFYTRSENMQFRSTINPLNL